MLRAVTFELFSAPPPFGFMESPQGCYREIKPSEISYFIQSSYTFCLFYVGIFRVSELRNI